MDVSREMDRLRAAKVGYDSMLARAAEIYRESDLVDSVRVVRDGVLIWWRDSKWGPEHGSIPTRLPPKPPFVERLRGEAKLMTTLLNMGGIEIRGSRFCLSVPARDLAKAEALIEKVKEQRWASEEDERALHAPPGRLEELINPRPLKKRGENQ